jgi:signal transduction histidine kinase
MRRQLAVLVTSTTSVVVIAFLVPLALLVRELAEDRSVRAATQEAQNIALLVGVIGEGHRLDTAVGLVNQQNSRETTVFLSDGGVVGAPAERSVAVRRAAEGLAFAAETGDGYEVLQPVATSQGRQVVRVLVPESQLHEGVGQAWLILAALGAGLIAVALVVADRLARRIAGPLGDLAEATQQLGEGRLDVRVEPVGPPEIVELSSVVNRLARRIQALLAAEREAVADLSHRLRTPITALRLDSEGLRDPAEAERVGRDVDALERAVDDVIREARRPADAYVWVDAVEAVRDRVAFWAALADDQHRSLRLQLPTVALPVALSRSDLGAVLDALLENALSYTPDGVTVHVRVEPREGGGAILTVEDEGPGFPDATQARGSSGAGSTGLGLDIARRTATASGGRLELGRGAAGGASVHLELGPPRS